MDRARTSAPLLVAAAIALAAFAALTPGVVTWDGMVQYRQALSGRYDDWHPPVMALLWSCFIAIGLVGSAPMLALQLALFWGGLGLAAAALVRRGAHVAAAVALAGGAMPVLAGWMGCVLKDCQLVGALVAGTGIVSWFRLDGRRVPRWAVAPAALAFGYALLLRANAVFAVAPLLLGLADWAGVRSLPGRIALLGGATALAIAAMGPIDHRLIGAERSHVERTLFLFDLAGIAHHAKLATLPDLPPPLWRQAEAQGCYSPFFWDPLGDVSKCAFVGTPLAFDRDEDWPPMGREWLTTIATHPIAYAAHRMAHLNDTLRIAVPASERLATAPAASIETPWRIGEPARPAAAWVARIADAAARTPAGAPAVWLVLGLGLWWTLAGTLAQPARTIGMALAASACLATMSFAVVSIASDLRYHLWLIAATMLAIAMLIACRGIDRRRLRTAIVATAAACFASLLLRSGLLPVATIPG